MAKYTLERNDGTVYELEGPEGASKEDLVRVLEQKMRPQQPSGGVGPAQSLRELYAGRDAAIEPREFSRTIAGRAGEVFRGIPRGAVGLLETAATGASALLPEGPERAAREMIARTGEAAAAPFQPKPGYEDSISAQFGEAAGSFVPFLAAGPFGLAGRVAARGLGAAAGGGTARERAEQGGATDEERALSTGLGSLVGISEAVVPLRILGNAIGEVPASGILNRLRRAVQAGGEEGLQEAAAEVAQNLIERGVYNPEQGAFTGTGESFGYGAGVGGLAQGLFDLFAPGRGRAPAAPQAEPVKDVLEGGEEELGLGEISPAVAETVAPSPVPPTPTETELTLDDILNEGAQARAARDADTFYPRSDLDREANRARGNIRELEDDLISDLTRVSPTPAETPATLEPALDAELARGAQGQAQRDQEQARRDQEAQAAAQTAATTSPSAGARATKALRRIWLATLPEGVAIMLVGDDGFGGEGRPGGDHGPEARQAHHLCPRPPFLRQL
jgi:hypothetical protein